MFAFSWFRHRYDASAALRVAMDRDELAFALGDPAPLRLVETSRRLDEADAEYSARAMKRSKDALPLVSTALFANDHRLNETVEAISMLGLDLDEPTADPAAVATIVRDALGGVEIFVYSTVSSMPGAFKLRALIPYDRPATGEEHRASWHVVARVLAHARVKVDRSCCDPARGFYVWSVPPSGAYFHSHLAGDAWPVELAARAEAERAAEEQARRAVEASQRAARHPVSAAAVVERARKYVAAMPAAIAGSGGHAAAFAVARRLVADFELPDADAWELLIEFNARCRPPWSERELRHKLASAQKARVRVDLVSQ